MGRVEQITLPDGLTVGRIEGWADDPEIFDAWLESETETDRLLVNGTTENMARLEVVRAYLVRECKLQEGSAPGRADYDERMPHIRVAFDMQKELTRKEMDLRGIELPIGKS